MADQPSAKPTVHIVQTGESYVCSESQSLLQGMIKLGRKCIPVGCVSGGCGVCKVRVVKGQVNKLGPVSRAHVSLEEDQQGYTLACRVAPTDEVWLEVACKLEKLFSKGFAAPKSEIFNK
jgi:3-phenylpropionate/trans-cinnamate dioxygenase ferredoxin reductase subunit